MIKDEETMQTILIIDDAKENIIVLSRLLQPQANMIFALNGEDGLEKAAAELPALILLDIAMPGLDGFEVLDRLKRSPATAEIPVIFITGIPDTDTEERALSLGAVDYITKPFAPSVVKARIRHQLKLQRLTNNLKEANERLTLLAMLDPLTGTHNRRHFLEIMEKEIARTRRHKHPLSLIIMDLDHFKKVNDTYGHDIGDLVIIEAIRISSSMLRQNDVLGRLGGEEFTILLPETTLEEAYLIANRLCSEIAQASVQTPDCSVKFTVSCGLSRVEESDEKPVQPIKRADIALYQAKRNGRNRAVAFDDKS